MSVSATRTLAAIGVLTAGVACAALFRKDPGTPSAAVAERPGGSSGVQWQAAPYPDAISLPNSVATWPHGMAPPAPGVDGAASALSAVANHGADRSSAGHDPAAATSNALGPAASTGLASSDPASAVDTRRLPASIGGAGARPRDPLVSAKQPPDLAPRYGDVQNLEGRGTSIQRLPPMPAPTHVIRDGDTLASIARRYLGDADRWLEIYELNRDVLPDAEILPIGLELRLPPADLVPVKRPSSPDRTVIDFASSRPE